MYTWQQSKGCWFARSLRGLSILLVLFVFCTAMTTRQDLRKAPEFQGEVWFNTADGDRVHLRNLAGRVVVVLFWTVEDIRSAEAVAWLNAWYATYHNVGLEAVGIHSAEFAFYATEEKVLKAIEELQIRFPVVLDQDLRDWHSYNPPSWPTFFLVDRNGLIRAEYDGLFPVRYQEMYVVLKTLLEEGPSK